MSENNTGVVYSIDDVRKIILGATKDSSGHNSLIGMLDQLVRRGFVRENSPTYYIWEQATLGEIAHLEEPAFTNLTALVCKTHAEHFYGIINGTTPIGEYFDAIAPTIDKIDAKKAAKDKNS